MSTNVLAPRPSCSICPLLDHAGPVVGWVNASGQVIEHRVFDPYGRVARRIGVGSTEIPVGHQGLIHETLDYAQGTNHLGLPSGPRLAKCIEDVIVID